MIFFSLSDILIIFIFIEMTKIIPKVQLSYDQCGLLQQLSINMPFFLHPGPAYWDLTLPMERASRPLHFPMVSLETPLEKEIPLY